jgi:protein-tyrosine phosphatase
LAALNPQDLAQLKTLAISRSFDFRGIQESQAQFYEWPGIQRYSLSIEPTVVQRLQAQHLTGQPLTAADALDAMQTTYRDFVRSDSHRFAQLFEHLLEKPDPLLFHCTAGKDRTGLAAALILYALGVDDNTIFEDYEATNYYRRKENAKAIVGMQKMYGIEPQAAAALMGAKKEYIAATFATIRAKYGSIDVYLEKELGLTNQKINQLRALYTH